MTSQFKEKLACGNIGTLTYGATTYDLVLKSSGCPNRHSLDLVSKENGADVIASLDAGNGLLEFTVHGKWIGLSTVCCYNRGTWYCLYDLSMTLDPSASDDGFICVGGDILGFFKDKSSTTFQMDFNKERVVWNDGNELSFEELATSDDHYSFGKRIDV